MSVVSLICLGCQERKEADVHTLIGAVNWMCAKCRTRKYICPLCEKVKKTGSKTGLCGDCFSAVYGKDVEGQWPWAMHICVRCGKQMQKESEDGMCVQCRHIVREERDKPHMIEMDMTAFRFGDSKDE